jgi:hypothetical protein
LFLHHVDIQIGGALASHGCTTYFYTSELLFFLGRFNRRRRCRGGRFDSTLFLFIMPTVFQYLFRAVATLASSSVVVVEVLDLASLWWFGWRFWVVLALLCCFVLGLDFMDCFLVILMRCFLWCFCCSRDSFGGSQLLWRQFQVVMAELVVLLWR